MDKYDDESSQSAIEHLIDGVFNVERFLQLQRNFTAFDSTDQGLVKRIAKPHQYVAVTKAVGATIAAAESNGKAGVVWHTQGSGKSMEMELYAHLVSRQPKLENPTVIVVTDRRDLDDQLQSSFERSLLLGNVEQMQSRVQLRTALSDNNSGGIYFTTLQKSASPPTRRNPVSTTRCSASAATSS